MVRQFNLVGCDDLAAQTAQAMRNVGLALRAPAPATPTSSRSRPVDYSPEHRAIVGKARGRFFAGMSPPTSTQVGVAALAVREWRVEIEAVAIVD